MKLPPNLKTNPDPNSNPNPNQGVVFLWEIARTPYKYNSIELWNFKWLYKIIEKIRSSQDFILTNSCSEANFSQFSDNSLLYNYPPDNCVQWNTP